MTKRKTAYISFFFIIMAIVLLILGIVQVIAGSVNDYTILLFLGVIISQLFALLFKPAGYFTIK